MRYFNYPLAGQSGAGGQQPGLYGNVIGFAGHVQVAVYFDRAEDLESAAAPIRGISVRPKA